MVAVTPMPLLRDLREMYTELLGRQCSIQRTHEPLDVRGGYVVGAYVDDLRRLAAVVATDVPLGAVLGAAIGLLPPGAAADAGEAGRLSDTMLENLGEVLNITAALFNVEDAPHLRLERVHDPCRDTVPGEVRTALQSTNRRVDAELEVAGYGGGRLAMVVRGADW